MDFLASPIHNYNFETFDDGFFDLPKEMDFDVNDDFKESMSYSVDDDDDDLNNGMYGVWSSKHPWSLNNSSNSMYSSNLHLDFIGGDPESAIMVNPNIVIPNGFQRSEDEVVKIEKDVKEEVPVSTAPKATVSSSVPVKREPPDSLANEDDAITQTRKIKSKFLSLKENITFEHEPKVKPNIPKVGVRVLKPAIIDSSNNSTIATITVNGQKVENSRLKGAIPAKNANSPKNGFYYQSETFYPKPAFSYSCLIAMALKNSKHGCLPVAEIYNFMCNHFPYFKTAPNGWKNSVRHNLSLNKCFEKIEKPAGSTQRKGCLWALNPNKAAKLEDEVQKWTKKDAAAIKRAMEYPEHLELLERGELKSLYDTEQSLEDEEDDMDINEEDDTEPEEPAACEEDVADERLSEAEEDPEKTETEGPDYPVLNIADSTDLPEFNIEVDGSIYEELIGSIENDQLFTINAPASGAVADPNKKVNKFFITEMKDTAKTIIRQNKNTEPEIYDHYDINNLLRFESENKVAINKKRFNKRICNNSRIKQIKFKTWN